MDAIASPLQAETAPKRLRLSSVFGLLLLTATLMIATPPPTAQAGINFCTNYQARPGALACLGPFGNNWTSVIAGRGAYLACAAARDLNGNVAGGWWCTTTGNYVTHRYPETVDGWPWIRSQELPPGAVNVISGGATGLGS